jgi:HSP20 family protein
MAEQENRLAHWDPFRELELFERWNPWRELGFGGSPFRHLEQFWREAGTSRAAAPAIDVSEDEDKYVVTAEIPGTKREDVTVEVKDDVLSIRGEKKSEREEKKEHVRWSERTYGSFVRSFQLPPNANGDRIAASFQNGVLRLEIPKREEAKPKVIAVK